MVTSLEKYNKGQLATLETTQLMRAVDKYVRSMFAGIDSAANALKEAEHAMEDAGEDAEKVTDAAQKVKQCRIELSQRIKELNNYVEEQQMLLESKKLNKEMVYSWAIVPTGTNDHGVEMCRLVKRGETFAPADIHDDNNRSVKRSKAAYEKVDMCREQCRGKYNDGHLLFDLSTISIDRSEMFEVGNV